jgi:hypothetical protein
MSEPGGLLFDHVGIVVPDLRAMIYLQSYSHRCAATRGVV